MNKKIILFISACLLAINLSANTITVTSSADTGAGTLREAVTNADDGDIIVFDDNVTTVYFAGVIKLDKNITISGNETNNTIFQNGTWTDTANKKRYFEILSGAEVTFNHLTLKDNTANCTGGAITNSGKLTLNNCTFSNNRSSVDDGGAINNPSSSIFLIINNCNFIDNYAPRSGGAINITGGEIHITNSYFENNKGDLEAGAIKIHSTLTSTSITNISNCTFYKNTAKYGSAILNANRSNLKIDKCIFTENNSTVAFGTVVNSRPSMSSYSSVLNGSLMNTSATEPTIFVSNSIFNENKSSSKEIFTNCFGANATVMNCLFTENITQTPPNNNQHKYYPDWQNHGIISNLNLVGYRYNFENISKLTVINTTITDNNAVGLYTNGETEFYNNIIWNNIEYDVFANAATEIINYANNLIGTSNIDLNGNNNIIDENPLFVGYGDYSLQETSPAIDKGNNAYIPAAITADLLGNPRISNTTVDMGAYEFQYEIYHTVTFAGDDISIDPQVIEYGNHATRPADPERTNYNFNGWYTDNGTFLNKWNFDTNIVTQDTTLYAKWSSTVGITEIESTTTNIYPNPAKDELRIESNGLTITKLEIVDLSGKTIVNLKSEIVNSINVSALPQGVYFVKMETDNGIVTRKFVKE
jgi:uncharacterized repeat protein (TIGR02543 family)